MRLILLLGYGHTEKTSTLKIVHQKLIYAIVRKTETTNNMHNTAYTRDSDAVISYI